MRGVSFPKHPQTAGADSLLALWSPGCCRLSRGVSAVCLARPDRTVVAHLSPRRSEISVGFLRAYVSLWV